MPARLNTETFIRKATKIHGDTYDYSLVDYHHNISPVKIICREHGIFEMRPKDHLYQKSRCPLCQSNAKKPTSKFIEEARKVHGDSYDYSLVEYVNTKTPVSILCKSCNTVFKQSPVNHMKGCGCEKCSYIKRAAKRVKTQEDFERDVKEIHEDSLTVVGKYVRNIDKIEVLCNSCNNLFKITGRDLLSGNSCALCAKTGFKINEDAFLYFLVSSSGIKVGVSNNRVADRLRRVNKKSPDKFSIGHIFKGVGKDVLSEEKRLHRLLSEYYDNYEQVFDGYTEAFVGNVEDMLSLTLPTVSAKLVKVH